MKSICSVLIAVTVLISVPYMLSADAAEMKYVPFWWSTDPLTGEEVYTDYFSQSSSVQREHDAYLAQSALDKNKSTFSPSTVLEVESTNMVEVITYEYKWIKTSESSQPQGPFANPDFVIRELVKVSTWIEAPVVEEEITEEIITVTEEITEEITPEIVPEITEPTPEPVPVRVPTYKGETHWDQEEVVYNGQDVMTPQEYKDMKKKHEEWKAYQLASELMPTLFPPYVHDKDYSHHETVEKEVEEPVIVVPLNEPSSTDITEPVITNHDEIVVPLN